MALAQGIVGMSDASHRKWVRIFLRYERSSHDFPVENDEALSALF